MSERNPCNYVLLMFKLILNPLDEFPSFTFSLLVIHLHLLKYPQQLRIYENLIIWLFDICYLRGSITGESKYRCKIWCKAGNTWRSCDCKQGILLYIRTLFVSVIFYMVVVISGPKAWIVMRRKLMALRTCEETDEFWTVADCIQSWQSPAILSYVLFLSSRGKENK